MSDLSQEFLHRAVEAKLDRTALPPKINLVSTPKQSQEDDAAEEDPVYNEYGERRLSTDERAVFRNRVISAEALLYDNIKGQDQAIEPVISALKRAVTGARDEGRPIATMLEVGPTGTGKTLLGKVLARALADGPGEPQFGFIKVDCSEFSQGHEIARLTGSPPGYVGYNDQPQLQALMENPFQVVLFDEIEKAHPKFHNLLLQILEDGELTLGKGEKVSFRNTIILLTSNAGVRDLDEAINTRRIGFTADPSPTVDADRIKGMTIAALRNYFTPEFFNRIDEVLPFRSFTPEAFAEIAQTEITRAIKEIQRNSGCRIDVEPAVVNMVAHESFNPALGAREVRRFVDKLVRQTLAEALFEMDPAEVKGATLNLMVRDDGLVVRTLPNKPALRSMETH